MCFYKLIIWSHQIGKQPTKVRTIIKVIDPQPVEVVAEEGAVEAAVREVVMIGRIIERTVMIGIIERGTMDQITEVRREVVKDNIVVVVEVKAVRITIMIRGMVSKLMGNRRSSNNLLSSKKQLKCLQMIGCVVSKVDAPKTWINS